MGRRKNETLDETTTPVSGKPMEIVNDRIINQTQRAFFRLKVAQ